jgi:ankyrin repeat protein
MDTLPLPPRPDIEQYRKRAKSLVTAANADDPNAVKQWAADWLNALTRLLDVEITPFVQGSFDRAVEHLTEGVATRRKKAHDEGETFALADAQHLIAQAHSYENWASFTEEVKALQTVSRTSLFERAADAVVSGDLVTLDDLLKRHPDLVRARSQRTHHVTLLHYIAANGVEDFRQKTPPNAVEVAERLIAAGADVDAVADTYGGDLYQTTLNLLVSSTHPAEAGLQSKLAEVLLDHGAAINGLEDTGSPILTALAFGYRESAETLAGRGARIDHVVMAAAVGRLDLVREWVKDANTLSNDHGPYRGPYWVSIPDGARGQIELALAWACKFGRADVARYLIEVGVSAQSQDNNQMTALHWASATGMLDVIDLLLARGAPLEVRNTWGGTVLDSTAWFITNFPQPNADYPQVVERLLKAGADPNEVYPPQTGVADVDRLLEQYRGLKKT